MAIQKWDLGCKGLDDCIVMLMIAVAILSEFPLLRPDNPSHADGIFSSKDVASSKSEALSLTLSCILINGKPGRIERRE